MMQVRDILRIKAGPLINGSRYQHVEIQIRPNYWFTVGSRADKVDAEKVYAAIEWAIEQGKRR